MCAERAFRCTSQSYFPCISGLSLLILGVISLFVHHLRDHNTHFSGTIPHGVLLIRGVDPSRARDSWETQQSLYVVAI